MTKKAVIITAQGFQDEEFVYPYYRLLEAGFAVDVATKGKVPVYGKFGVPARPTIDTEELKADGYDLVLLPGGFEAPDRVRLLPEVLEFVREMDSRKKLVAAICHGPWVLISAGITRGRSMTAYWSIEADVRNSGADYRHKEPVVIDENLITSPHYNNNGDFMRAVIAWFDGK
ncbi:MAG: type 1 glutamine amidotransferase [Deltaproteobacteria bacterium]|nr:type 1 glutamine amidotransferase [Deltaproteobacteria bacterium]MDA8179214.1 type 1 glutamine amidotransferase [Deltaproteobacteria bacterium]